MFSKKIIDHTLVLNFVTILLSSQVFIGAIVLEETRWIVRVLRGLSIPEEMEELFAVLCDPSQLLRSILADIRIALFRGVFEIVGLGSCSTFSNNFFDSSFCVCSA